MRYWHKRYINADLGGFVRVTTKGGATFIGRMDEVNDDNIILACKYGTQTHYWQVIDISEIAAFAWESGEMET